MADPKIQLPSLPSAGTLNTSDIMHVRQGAADKKVTLQVLKDLILGSGKNFTGAEILSLLAPVDGAGSGLDSDRLDGQHGSYYQNAGNLNSGTIPSARLDPTVLLARLLTVDGSGSNLDADLLDGQQGSYYRNAGNMNAGILPSARLNGLYNNASILSSNIVGDIPVTNLSATDILNLLLTVDGAGSGLDSDFLDGGSGAFYRNADNLNAGTVSQNRLPTATTTQRGIAEAATSAELASSNSTTLFASPPELRNGHSFNTNAVSGYWKAPPWLGSFTIQWGYESMFGNSTRTVNLPLPFVNYITTFASFRDIDDIDASCGAVPFGASQIRIRNSGDNTNVVGWFAIGIT